MIRSMMRCSVKDFHTTSHHTSLLHNFHWKLGNSADNLRHPRSVAYSVELVLLIKQQISGCGGCLYCNRNVVPQFSSCCDQQYSDFFFGTFACFAWMCKLTVVDCIVHSADLIVCLFLLALCAFSTFLHFCFIDFTWILVQAIYIHLMLYKNTI